MINSLNLQESYGLLSITGIFTVVKSPSFHTNVQYYATNFETIARVSTVLTLSLHTWLFLYSVAKTEFRKTFFEIRAKNCGINKYRCLITDDSSKYYSKFRGNFYTTIGNTEVISQRYELTLGWLSFS